MYIYRLAARMTMNHPGTKHKTIPDAKDRVSEVALSKYFFF